MTPRNLGERAGLQQTTHQRDVRVRQLTWSDNEGSPLLRDVTLEFRELDASEKRLEPTNQCAGFHVLAL